MSHTPGPWEVCEEKVDGIVHFEIQDSKGRVIVDTYNSEVAEIREEIDEDYRRQWDEQGRKDITLMAAAPDLLAACKAVFLTMTYDTALRAQVKAAIAKAESAT